MRRQALWRIVLFVLGCYAWTTGALAQAPQGPGVEAVEAVGMTVADMEREVRLRFAGRCHPGRRSTRIYCRAAGA